MRSQLLKYSSYLLSKKKHIENFTETDAIELLDFLLAADDLSALSKTTMHDIAPPRKSVAQRNQNRPRPSPSTGLEMSTGRVRDIAALHGLGFSYREIAEHYKVTPQAVSLLLARNRRKIEAIGGLPTMATLSTRAVSALQSLGVKSRHDVQSKDVLAKLHRTRNCGTKTFAEISDWLNASTS